MDFEVGENWENLMETEKKKGLQEFLLSITIRIPCGPIHSIFIPYITSCVAS